MNIEFSAVLQDLPQLMDGARVTLIIAAAGISGGLVVGVLLALMRVYGGAITNGIAFAYIELIRGIPLMVEVMFIYFALPLLIPVHFDPLTASITAIVVNSSAFVAEILRGALLSISDGLKEAGLSLGLPLWEVLLSVTGPLALRRALPALGNQFIASLKDTSLFIVIGVGELTNRGQEIISVDFRAVEVWAMVAIIYLAIINVLAMVLRLLEKKYGIL